MIAGKGARIFTGTVRVDPLFEAIDPARALSASVTFDRPLSSTLKYFSHCAAIALCRARETYC